jgi:hypothetical protein
VKNTENMKFAICLFQGLLENLLKKTETTQKKQKNSRLLMSIPITSPTRSVVQIPHELGREDIFFTLNDVDMINYNVLTFNKVSASPVNDEKMMDN